MTTDPTTIESPAAAEGTLDSDRPPVPVAAVNQGETDQGAADQGGPGVAVDAVAAHPVSAGENQAGGPAAAADNSSLLNRPRIQVGRSGGSITSRGDAPPAPPRGGSKGPPHGRPPRPKSRREKEAEEDAAEAERDQVRETQRVKVAPPSRRQPLSEDLQVQWDTAMGAVSMDALVDGNPLATEASQPLEPETRRRAAISRIHGDNVFFSLGGRNEGVASLRQFKSPPNLGDEFDVVVKGFHADDGLYNVVIPGGAIEVADWSDLVEGAVVEVRITGANTGGIEGMVNSIRGFIPTSQIAMYRVENLSEFIGQKLACVVMEAKPNKKKLVLSRRAVLEREREEARQQVLASIDAGTIREGVVRSIRDFGAFVDLGGVDGLIHVSQMSWERINHPSEVLTEGQQVRVRVEKINAQTGKISLSYRDLLEHPWHNIELKFPVGTVVKGPVSRLAKFGAFVKLAPGIEGLIHVSELAHQHVRRVEDVLKEGQEVEAKVLSVDREAQRIALSLKATLAPPEPEAAPEPEPTSPQAARPKRNKPLKGGFDHPTGGERFGLKW